jgi:hypothetical protein
MDEYRRELYEERAELAELESEIAEGQKYMKVGGLFWRIGEWLDRMCKRERAEVQAEIDRINTHPTTGEK